MRHTKIRRVLCMLLSVLMVSGFFATAALAYNEDFVSETHDVFKHTESVLAPGVDHYINYAYAKDGKQMVYYVAVADIGRDDVEIHSAYKDAQCEVWGMAKLTEEMAAADAKYQQTNPNFKVVAGTNGDFYNMSTGQPSGAFVMDGVNVTANGKANNRPWFAVFADGTALCGANNAEWDAAETAHGAAQEAVGGSQMLVVNGEDSTANAGGSYNTDRHSRTMVGVTADNKVVMAVLDGRQEPFSCGGTMHELAQIMLEAGCVMAINLDGGGSTTFAARPEGENEVRVINRPSDGSERSISNGLLIASTAPASDVFDHAALTADYSYVLPNAVVNISAKGVSPAGTAAEIPEGVTYTATLGTVTNEGVFTSDGTVGDAVITMQYNGADVGSVTVHVLYPTALQFAQETITVPYGKTVQLELQATCNDGMNPVLLRPGDVQFTLAEPAIGTIEGFNFTAAEEGVAVTESAVTATIPGTELTASTTVKLGRGSQVLWDFEDEDVSGFKRSNSTAYNYVWTPGEVSLASVGDGQVHSGEHAMRVNLDYSVWMEGGYMLSLLSLTGEHDLYGATKLGMWIYFPDEAASLQCRLFAAKVTARDEEGKITEAAANYTSGSDLDNGALNMWNVGFVTRFEESGWHYASFDLSDNPLGYNLQGTFMQFYINDRDNATNNYNHLDYKSCNQNINLYFDDITLDYSSAVDDREAPVFDKVTWADPTMSDAAEFTRGTVAQTTADTISFGAVVHENTALANFTGLDASTAKAYVDGVEMPCTLAGGIMSAADVTLADGLHTVKFTICDRQGNYASVIREINVNANSGKSTVKLVPHDPSLDKILMGSLYYVDLVVTDIENVKSVSADLDLNNMSVWELDHMDVAEGFEASYIIKDADDKVAALTITRTGESELTGEQALVSIPVRTWELPITVHDYGAHKGQVVMYPGYKASNELLPIDIRVGVDRGIVTFTDDTTSTFSGKVQIDTELDSWFYNDTSARDEEYQAWNGGHDHRPETAQYYTEEQTNHVMPEAVPDKPATCTEPGYTGRTYCPVCHSIVNWGETIPATGHNYKFVDGRLVCTVCGEPFNGTWTDGRYYVDGYVIADGWLGDSYYRDGYMLTGLQEIDGYYYDFGDDGVCPGHAKLDSFYYDETVGAYRYFTAGIMAKGDVCFYPEAYFFDENGIAISGEQDILGYSCQFSEKGAFVSCTDANVKDAGFSGTNIKFVLLNDGTLKVDGEGEIRDYFYSGNFPAWIVKNGMEAITALELGNGITKIGKYAFYRHGYLRTITFESNSVLKTIAKGAFGHCWRLTGVTIPASVEVLKENAFYECSAITYFNVEEPSNLKTIGSCAFQNAHWLETAYIPGYTTELASDIFYGANEGLILQVVENSAAHYYAIEHNLNFELREGVVYPIHSGICTDSIEWNLYPDGSLKITGSGAMANYTSYGQQPWANYRHLIKKIVIGKDITSIGNYAFCYSQNVETVEFEEGSKLTRLGVLAFCNLPKIKAIILPESVARIEAYALSDCFALANVYIPQGTSFIYATAFNGSTNVVLNVADGTYAEQFAIAYGIQHTVRDFEYIPSASGNCGENAEWAFYGNGELRITGSGAMADYTSHSQQPWSNYRRLIKKIVIGKDITSIGNYAFCYSQNVETVEFEAGSELTRLGILAFRNLPKITDIVLPESVSRIEAYALSNCFALANAYIPQNTCFMHAMAFDGSTNVVLNVAESTYAEQFAEQYNIAHTSRPFDYTISLANGNCGENAEWVFYGNGELRITGSGAMADYTSHSQQPWAAYRHLIKKIVIGRNITSIGNYAFAYSQNVESVEFSSGSKLTRLGVLAFCSLPKIKAIILPDGVARIEAYALGNCYGLVFVYIPDGTSFIYPSAFQGSTAVILSVAANSYALEFAQTHNIVYAVRGSNQTNLPN